MAGLARVCIDAEFQMSDVQQEGGARGERAVEHVWRHPDEHCQHDWNVGYCMKCRGHHDCYLFVDDVCQVCGTMA